MTFSDAVPGTDGEELTEPPTQVKSVKLIKNQCQTQVKLVKPSSKVKTQISPKGVQQNNSGIEKPEAKSQFKVRGPNP